MSIKSALFAVATTVVLILVLGNDWMADRARDGDFAQQTRLSVVALFQFQFWDMPSELRGATIARLVALVVLAGVLGGIVGRARPAAAFVGGWACFLAAAVLSAGIYSLVVDDAFSSRPGSDGIDEFTLTASFGAPAGLWLGWLVGLAVMLGSFGAVPRRSATAGPAPAPAPAPGSWPPPPGPFGGSDPGAPPPPHPGTPPPHPGTPPPQPGAPPPPPAPGPPMIGPPPDPDRTQVFGEPPRRDG